VAKYVPDITTNRWVIVAEGRTKRPSDNKPKVANINKICVFCPGFERIPGEELFRIGKGQPYESGWQVRVIKNKYPITDFHEVIIHSPSDELDIHNLPLAHVEAIIEAYRARFVANTSNGHVIIFNNVGEAAGASIKHPHSQMVVVPKQITIDTLSMEPVVNVVLENKSFTVFCPDFSQWPFEVWIAPKTKEKLFGEITDTEIADLAPVLQGTIKKLLHHLADSPHDHPGMPVISFKGGPAYNFYIHHAKDWYIRIVPRLVHRAGFELGTGIQVNIIDPADAAETLKQEIPVK
jgi:UDPglucose--hexose-1-phosphate uridylyltransferase